MLLNPLELLLRGQRTGGRGSHSKGFVVERWHGWRRQGREGMMPSGGCKRVKENANCLDFLC